ncbi:MAG: IS200/IS605 family transposase, partial [Rickettsia sp.]|nr:IS200/IS605 family transposase [Rickettsia sp.]
TKYRKKLFFHQHLLYMNKIFSYLCKNLNMDLVEFNGEQDHVHLLIKYPPNLSVSSISHRLKGASSKILRQNFTNLKRQSCLWSPSYFVSSCGGAPINILKTYIQNQKVPL